MIREATIEDVDELVRMSRAFFEANNWPANVNYSEDSIRETIHQLIRSDNAVIFMEKGGMIAGLVFPFYFTGEMAGQELCWWVDPDKRNSTLGLRLLNKLEEWASGRCKHFSMICLEAIEPEKMKRLYEKRNYRLMEHHYMKEL